MTRTVSLIFFLLLAAPALARMPVILIVESYHPVLAWTEQCERGIRETLGPGYDVRSFYMDTKRIPAQEFAARAGQAWAAFEVIKPDLVMLGDDNALSMLGPRVAETGTPVVYFGINNNPRNYFTRLPRNVAGVLERTPVVPWLRHLSRIVPGAGRVLLLLDESLTSKSIIEQVFQNRTMIQVSGLLVGYHVATDWADWRARVESAKAYDFILTPTFHSLRGPDDYVDIETVVSWTSLHSPVPVFSNQDYTIGDRGFVGALVLEGTEHGRIAARIAREILEGGSLQEEALHRTDKDGQFYFSRKQLDRFGIVLPADIGAKALFRN